MEDVFIRIAGIASKKSIKAISSKLDIEKPTEYNSRLFFDYSYFDIPIGFKFLYLFEISTSESISPINGEIKTVTQQWAMPFILEVPKGHQTICNISFDKKSYELISSKIPTVDSWETLNRQFLIANVNNDGWKNFYAPLPFNSTLK